MFVAPARGMADARDRAPIIPAILLAFIAQAGFTLYTYWPNLFIVLGRQRSFMAVKVLSDAANSLIVTALIFVPVIILIANLFERRGSFRVAIQQEYAPAASAVFYAIAAANLAALPLAILFKSTGWMANFTERLVAFLLAQQQQQPDMAQWMNKDVMNPLVLEIGYLQMLKLPLLAGLLLIAVRVVFRFSWLRSVVVVGGSAVAMFFAGLLFSTIIGALLASPFVILLVFFLLRGYLGEVTRGHKARLSFKQNLEAATLNPADASAHYNLGLIHQQRNELQQARERFARAVEIDNDEIDAHYQLGRIARSENRLADAIGHFEPVVALNPAHSQHEVWREIGATYFAAGQFSDSRNALERFLEHRQADPEGLYLMGRVHAALGDQREAAASMQACIEAVKTAPAYMYRTEKRWLNEAQEFLRSKA
jgi:tetratricopeptide (TPR) repeat protein